MELVEKYGMHADNISRGSVSRRTRSDSDNRDMNRSCAWNRTEKNRRKRGGKNRAKKKDEIKAHTSRFEPKKKMPVKTRPKALAPVD